MAITQQEVLSTLHLPVRKAAKELGVARSTLHDARKRFGVTDAQMGVESEVTADAGAVTATVRGLNASETEDKANKLLEGKGVTKEAYNLSYALSEVSQEDKPTVYTVTVKAVPKKAELATWEPVQRAVPLVTFQPVYGKKPKSDWKTTIVLPDPQIGYRLLDGELVPFHDEAAINIATQIVKDVRPDEIIHIGDFLDLPAFGKYEQEPAFAQTTQAAIDYGHSWLTELQQHTGKQVMLEGNHEARLRNMITANASAALGIKRAGEELPVFSIPYLLRFDEMGIEYIGGYPAGQYWINDKLRCIHGKKVNSRGSTAATNLNDLPHVSTIFGHVHRQEVQSKTTFDRNGAIKSYAITPGCLTRIDGHVPSMGSGNDVQGNPVQNIENWAQGLLVVHYKDTGEFFFDLVQIIDGTSYYNGVEYNAA